MANIEHEALAYGEGHVIHFVEYANSTLREAASGLTSGDDHKVALQTDDHSLWVLTDYTGPTWVPMFGTPGDDTVTGAKIVDDAVDSEHYTDGSIDLAHMSANSVDSDQYVDGSIDRAHLSADCVDGTKIENDAIDSEHYTDGSIDTAHIGTSQVTLAKIATAAVGTAQIATNAVTAVKIATDSVNASEIVAGAVGTSELAADAVDDTKIGDAKIKKEHINADVVGTGLAGGAGTALSVDGIVEVGASAELKVKVINIGDWNMDSTASVNVAHGVTLDNIRSVDFVIKDDNSTNRYMSRGSTAADGEMQMWVDSIGATNIVLARLTGGYFDTAAFDATSFNRGYVTIFYQA